MIGNDIDNDLEAGVVAALDQVAEFLQALGRVFREVRIYAVVILDRVGGAGAALTTSGSSLLMS